MCAYELQHSLMLCKWPVFLLNPPGNPTQGANALRIHANSVVIINSLHPLETWKKSRFSERFEKNKYLNISPTFGLKLCWLMAEDSLFQNHQS